MPRYRLIDDGYTTFKNIYQGKRRVGRVCKCADGSFLALIGKDEAKASTESEAFRLVAAKALGFATPADLASHNSAVRARNSAARARGHALADRLLSGGNLDAIFDELLNLK
jgi:hypothetical protein